MIRIREVTKTMHFGKIYRDGASPLKKCGIKQNAHLLCELLSEPQHYSEASILIYLRKRKINERVYEPMKMEFIDMPGPYPTLEKLKLACAKAYGLDPEKTSIAKYVPYQFTWEKITPPKPFEGKKKKKAKSADNISQPPYLFKEGGNNSF